MEGIRPERDTSRNPLFQSMFALHNVPLGGLSLPGVAVRSFEIEPRTAQFDVEMSLFEGEGAISGRLHWSTDLFTAGTMERFAAHFLRLVRSAARDPDLAVHRASILPGREKRALLSGFNATARTFEIEPTLVGLFEAQADTRSAAPALRAAGRDLSYAELDVRANRLARLLSGRGVGRGDRVGVCLERGVDLITAVIAALKAGAAIVPLDPTMLGSKSHSEIRAEVSSLVARACRCTAPDRRLSDSCGASPPEPPDGPPARGDLPERR